MRFAEACTAGRIKFIGRRNRMRELGQDAGVRRPIGRDAAHTGLGARLASRKRLRAGARDCLSRM